jgi:hypothetical protein
MTADTLGKRCPFCQNMNPPEETVCTSCKFGDISDAAIVKIGEADVATRTLPRPVLEDATGQPKDPKLKLDLQLIDQPERSFSVCEGQTIGRRDTSAPASADVLIDRVPKLGRISRCHARFEHRDGTWYVIHLGKVNYVEVDGQRYHDTEPVSIRDGSVLMLSETAFRVKVSAD